MPKHSQYPDNLPFPAAACISLKHTQVTIMYLRLHRITSHHVLSILSSHFMSYRCSCATS